MKRLGVAINCDTVGLTTKLAKRAEENGFEVAWTWDTPTRNGYVTLGAMAAATSTIKVASGVAVAWGRSPTIHVTAARDIDEISNGRFILGLGSGTKRQIDYWYSILVEHPAPRMHELVQVIRMLFSKHAGAKIDYEGRSDTDSHRRRPAADAANRW
jgi:alkanesulfonate monooxygenase SsuD/methylene tetrahydromethanopterin reductase-like flavin-dependent oxidoreductase (luciferase family)